jgi:hypothetical protein
MSTDPTMFTATASRISGARARAISSVKMICSFSDAPRPPCSRGHWMPTHPPDASSRCQARWKTRRSDSSSGGAVRGRCAASHSRSVVRKASSSGVYRRPNMRAVVYPKRDAPSKATRRPAEAERRAGRSA